MRLSRAASVAILVAAMGQGSLSFAVDICGETVPANRFIDGYPAYAQCAGASSSAIYSNNGIDTSTTSGGTGWVRTQGSGGYQCTELAHRYLYFRWNVTSVPNGNAGVWCDGTIPTGVAKVTTPVHGDLIVFAPGSCGADGTTGHVAVIDVVNTDSTVTAVQQNSAGRSKYNFTCAACFLHVAANDGTTPDAGAPIDAGTPTDTGMAPKDASAVVDSAGARDAGTGGAAGPTGTGGAAGPMGTGGAVGPMGTGGAAGPMGTGGAAGPMGTGGAAGPMGTGGAVGPTGTGGLAGPMGTGGLAGMTGAGPGATSTDIGAGCACAVVDGRCDGLGFGLLTLLGFLGVVTSRRRRHRSGRPSARPPVHRR